jgi:hypothetical protein
MLRRGMTDRDDKAADLTALARDWITLWQSEIAALAHDREAAEATARLAAIWGGLAATWLRAAPTPREPPAARPDATAGAAPAAAAPDAGGDALGRVLGELADRLGAIEARLAALERGARSGDRPGAGRPRRRRRD